MSLELVYTEQKKLISIYDKLEAKNTGRPELLLLYPDFNFDLDSIQIQLHLKDIMWRITEELGEAYEAFAKNKTIKNDHFYEELSDALHFFMELMIFSNIQQENMSSFIPYLNLVHKEKHTTSLIFTVIHLLTMGGNCLKQKAWKQSHQKTDKNKYLEYIRHSFIFLLKLINLPEKELYHLYLKKNKINHFRIRSNY